MTMLAIVVSVFTFVYGLSCRPNVHFTLWLHTETAAWGILASSVLVLLAQNFRQPTEGLLAGSAAPVLLVLGFALHWWSIPDVVQRLLGTGCFALALACMPWSWKWLRNALSASPLSALGLWSFSIYLWQQPFYLLMHRGILSTFAAVALAVSAGLISYALVEKPLRDILNNRWTYARSVKK
jgi:peptidoglycan/LPS O-acetylase OafA/YrhL